MLLLAMYAGIEFRLGGLANILSPMNGRVGGTARLVEWGSIGKPSTIWASCNSCGSPGSHASKTKRGESHMIAGRMNLLAIIIIFLALATAGAVLYAAWELSSDKPADRGRSRAEEADDPDDPPRS